MDKKIKWLVYLSLFLMAGFLYSCRGEEPVVMEQLSGEYPDGDLSADNAAAGGEEAQPEEVEVSGAGMVYVYVCGAVNNPGVYELESGARIIDALEAAGGMNEAAAVSYVNQAQLLLDGQQIYIPTQAEAETYQAGTMPGETGTSAADGGSRQLININTATKEELMELNGIGEAKAGNIITWREHNGGFSKIEDITEVDGIGAGTFEKLKDYICVS